MTRAEWLAKLHQYGAWWRQRKLGEESPLEAELLADHDDLQAELERAKMQAFDFESGLGCVQAGLEQARAQVKTLQAACNELVIAADPHTNMSDIVLLDALARARSALAAVQEQEDSRE